MNNTPVIVYIGEYVLPDSFDHTLRAHFNKITYLDDLSALSTYISDDPHKLDTLYFVDIHVIQTAFKTCASESYIIALAQGVSDCLDHSCVRDYLYIGEYPKFESQLHRIFENIRLVVERRSFGREIERLYEVGKCLGTERNISSLINTILEVSMSLSGAEAGSFYSIVDARTGQWATYQNSTTGKLLKFEIAKNRRMPLSIESSTFPILDSTIVGSAVLLSNPIAIADVHNISDDKPYSYDARVELKTGYACKSMFTIPMRDKKGRVLGAIQLINKIGGNRIIPFNQRDEHMMEFLSSYAAIALENSHLYKEMNDLLTDYERIVQSADLQDSKYGDELSKLKDVIEMNPSALIITNPEGIILYANKQIEALTGYSPEEIIGKRPSIVRSGKTDPTYYETFWTAILTGNEWHGEFLNKNKKGELYWEKSSVLSIKDDDGSIKYFINTREDITELKDTNNRLVVAIDDLKTAQSVLVQNEKMMAIGQLAAGMAHEINNPLGFITSNIQTLGEYSKSIFEVIHEIETLSKDSSQELAMKIESASERADLSFIKEDISDLLSETDDGLTRVKKLVEAMRSYSNIDSLAEAGSFSINDAADTSLTIFKSVASGTCDITYTPGASKEIYGDVGKLQQALMNILMNAYDATLKVGHGSIVITTSNNETDVFCKIEDTGCGISEDIIGKIFDPFFTTKPIGEGAGLGLSQALSIVKTEFDGEISVDSRVGDGSCFCVRIPARL